MDRFLVIILILFAFSHTAIAGLNEARRELEADHLEQAAELYATVPFTSEAWTAKVEDLIRLHLLHDRFVESWRLTQVLNRVQREVPEQTYYTAVSLARAGVCPLGMALSDPLQLYLLRAFAYRFRGTYTGGSEVISGFDIANEGKFPHRFDVTAAPWLTGISTAKPVRNQGCFGLRDRLASNEIANARESAYLSALWTDLVLRQRVDSVPGGGLVWIRLLEVLEATKNPELTDALLQKFREMPVAMWTGIGSPENQFLWQRVFSADKITEVTNNPKVDLLREIILHDHSPSASAWLGLIAYDKLPVATRLELFEHLLKVPNVQFYTELLYLKATQLHLQGKMQEVLRVLRSLFIDNMGNLSDELERKCIGLAMMIFAEFQYDDAVQGALQASLPPHIWIRVLQALLVEHALAGYTRGYDHILKNTPGKRPLNFTESQLNLLRHLAYRNMGAFRAQLGTWNQRNRLSPEGIKLMFLIAAQVIGLSVSDRNKVRPFLRMLADVVEKARLGSKSASERLDPLLKIFDPDSESAFREGMATIAQGVVVAGVVDLKQTPEWSDLIPWNPDLTLSRRNLLLLPRTATDREWQIR